MFPVNHEWLDLFTRATLKALTSSNFYHAAGEFYPDFGTYNTGAHFIEELPDKTLFFHTLMPGSYYVINNSYGEAVIMVREMSLGVKALVSWFGKKKNGNWDWSNFLPRTRELYEKAMYTQMIDIVSITQENKDFNPEKPVSGENRQWITKTYELGSDVGQYLGGTGQFGAGGLDRDDDDTYLEISYSKRKPFIVGKSSGSMGFEYGEKGPTLDSLGLIKSLNKKAISKDQAIEQILRPAMQGPASLRKSYITTAANSYIPLDAMSLSKNGFRPVHEINPAIGPLVSDVMDMRQQVDRMYYADFLLYLSRNPKTRTATETNAIVQEQQMIIGPNLQSLNWTYNVPVVEFVMDWVLDEDPYLPPPPEDLAGEFLRPEFISVFAQAQRAADLPQVERYLAFISNVGQIDPRVLDKVNLDRVADIYEDRLYLPAGINNPQDKVDAMRQQAAMQQQRQQQLQEMTQMAGAAKDVGIKANNGGEQQ
jgi:hypothetical protein